MENQIIRIDKNNLLQILKAHYGKQQAEVSISTKKERIGIYENEACVTRITVKRKISISGVETAIVENLDDDDLKEILTEVLAENGMEVQSVELLNNLESRTTGYGMAEHTESYPKFNGAELRVKPNHVKRLVRN